MTAREWAERLREGSKLEPPLYSWGAQVPRRDCEELAAILDRAEALAGALEAHKCPECGGAGWVTGMDVEVYYDSAGYPHQEQVPVQEECEHCQATRSALAAWRQGGRA